MSRERRREEKLMFRFYGLFRMYHQVYRKILRNLSWQQMVSTFPKSMTRNYFNKIIGDKCPFSHRRTYKEGEGILIQREQNCFGRR